MTGPSRFAKMSGAGNDFVVLGPEESALLGDGAPAWARRVCRRGLSVGADGVLLVEREKPGSVRVTFLNPDGAEAFCGNGTRCAARFAVIRGLAAPKLDIETAIGRLSANVHEDRVRIALPAPVDLGPRSIEAAGRRFVGRLVDAGVPHYLVSVPSLDTAPLDVWGPALRHHAAFGAEGANVNLLEPRGEALAIRTYERGVEGETLACGSGAVAAAFAHRLVVPGDEPVTIVPRSGVPLLVELLGPPDRRSGATLEGDARLVFEGELSPEALAGWPP